MGKKLLEGKNGEYGFQHDSPEQIAKCLNCQMLACNGCVDIADPDDYTEMVDYKRPLVSGEKQILCVYVECEDDQEISKLTGISMNKVFRYRRRLGLPPPVRLTKFDRQQYVKPWMRN